MNSFSPCGKLGLAPMAGPGDSGFRRICRELGADYTVSEMISAKAIQYGADKTISLAKHTPEEEPMVLQLFGRDPDAIRFAAETVCRRFHPVGIDLNMGCPAPKIFKNGEGSALLREPELAASLVRAAKEHSDCPVSVKMRIGIDHIDLSDITAFACEMERAGAAYLTVHGRTRAQQYSGKADYTAIRAIKQAVSIPVIANGDIVDASSACRALEETGADGLALARGALGAPFVFTQIKAGLAGQNIPEYSLAERMDLCLRQLSYTIEDKGEELACIEFRKHLLWYLKGIPCAARYRQKAGQIRSFADCQALVDLVLLEQRP